MTQPAPAPRGTTRETPEEFDRRAATVFLAVGRLFAKVFRRTYGYYPPGLHESMKETEAL